MRAPVSMGPIHNVALLQFYLVTVCRWSTILNRLEFIQMVSLEMGFLCVSVHSLLKNLHFKTRPQEETHGRRVGIFRPSLS